MADMDHWPEHLKDAAALRRGAVETEIDRLGLQGDAAEMYRAMPYERQMMMLASLLRIHRLVTPGMEGHAARSGLVPMVGNPR